MAIRLRSTLKQWFKRGKYPLEEQFADWIDSFLHKTEDKLPLANVEGLPEQLNAKYNHASGVALEKSTTRCARSSTSTRLPPRRSSSAFRRT